MDKILAVIIIFLGITFSLAGILAMGAVPKIFQSAEITNETKSETENQTKLIIDYFEGQNKLMINQFLRENNTTHRLLIGLNDSLIKEDQALKNQGVMIKAIKADQDMNRVIAKQIFNVSTQHEIVARDHNKLQTKVDNMTQDIYDLLEEADRRNFNATMTNKAILNNLTQELKEIKTLHKEIKQELESINHTSKS
jgi:hypothetical protein